MNTRKNYRPIPEGFAEDAKLLTQNKLIKKYHATYITVWRWQDDLGMLPTSKGRRPRPVEQLDPSTMCAIRRWKSAKEAADNLFACREGIHHAAKHGRIAYGYRWRYAAD